MFPQLYYISFRCPILSGLNTDTERVFRTLKEDLIWPYDWDNPFYLETALTKWVHDYNTDFPHQTLDYSTPSEFYKAHLKEREVTLVLA